MPRPITILTQNILGGLPGWRLRCPLLARQLARYEPDLIALQEVHAPTHNPAQSQAHDLAAALGGYHASFAPGQEKARSVEGVALLSRTPLLAPAWRHLSQDTSDRFDKVGRRVVLRAGVMVDGISLVVGATHLSLSREARARTLPELLSFLSEEPTHAPRLLLGDLNADPSEPAIQALAPAWRDCWTSLHADEPGRTWPTFAPRFRVDYLFAAPASGWRVERCERLLTASDHRGLLARLAWTGEA